MRLQFTPGPWESMKNNSGSVSIFGATEQAVALVECMDVTTKNTADNAALITMAPELFGMLHALWVNIPSHVMEQYGIKEEEVTAVLLKATRVEQL